MSDTPKRDELLALIRELRARRWPSGLSDGLYTRAADAIERLAAKLADDGMREALHTAKAAMIRTRTASIAGCKEGYGKPQLWADELYASHGDLTKAIALCANVEAALSTMGAPKS